VEAKLAVLADGLEVHVFGANEVVGSQWRLGLRKERRSGHLALTHRARGGTGMARAAE
jgi:hypothetical protein